MAKHMTLQGLMTDEELAEQGIEFRLVKSTCSQCHQQHDVEILFSKDEPRGTEGTWRGICDPCHKELCG